MRDTTKRGGGGERETKREIGRVMGGSEIEEREGKGVSNTIRGWEQRNKREVDKGRESSKERLREKEGEI